MGGSTGRFRVAAGGHAVDVYGDDRTLAWLEFYVGRWWPVGPCAKEVGRIEASTGPLGLAGESDDDRPFDVVPTYYGVPGRRFAGDGVLVVVDDPRLAYRHDRAGRIAVIGEDRTWLEYATALVTRQLVRGYLESEGWVLLHAACVDGIDGGSLIIGPSGSGKTSTALHLAARGHGLLANDRCFVRATGGHVSAIPWPMPISIGLGLLAALGWGERVTRSVRAQEKQHHFQPQRVTEALEAEAFVPLFDATGHEAKYEAYPANLADWFGVRLASSTVVRRVLRPCREGADTAAIQALDAADFFSGRDSAYPNFLCLPEAPPARIAASIRALVEAVAALRQVPFTWGPEQPIAESAVAAAATSA